MELQGLVEIVEFSKWPIRVPLKPLVGLHEILFENLFWKSVDKSEVLHDISRKGDESLFYQFESTVQKYQKDAFLVGYNPIEDRKIKLSTIESENEKIIRNLRFLKNKYEKRAQFIQVCEPRVWQSLGSELEVEEAKSEIRSEKISVELLGYLSTRPKHRKLKSIFGEDSDSGFVEFHPDENLIYETELITRLDASVQVQVNKHNKTTQTDLTLIDPSNEHSIDIESIVQAHDQPSIELERADNIENSGTENTEKQDKCKAFEDHSFHFVRSFVNIEHRNKLISSTTWHPTRPDYVAISYVTDVKYEYERSNRTILLNDEVPLVRREYTPMSEHDIRINEKIYDILTLNEETKSSDSDDFTEQVEKEESENEESLKRGRSSEIYSFLGNSEENLIPKENHRPANEAHHTENKGDTEDTWFLEIENLCSHYKDEHKSIDQFTVKISELGYKSADEMTSDDSSDSETSLISQSFFVQDLQLCNEDLSDTDETVEDHLQITDTDSYALIWHINDDLSPKMKLYNIHDINVLKFCPKNGDLVAGGSISGQLVLWDVHRELDTPKPKKRFETSDSSVDFMENTLGWRAESPEFSILQPVASSERTVSHLYQITCMEWMHPSLKVTTQGKLIKPEPNNHSRQILTSSTDGRIKVWEIKFSLSCLPDSNEPIEKWNIELVYTITINNRWADKYPTSIRFFQLCIPSVQYTLANESIYKYVTDLRTKFQPLLTVSNDIGEVGVVRWYGKDDDKVENCKHEWWAQVHDSTITSLSRNYYFPTITLSTGGRIFSLWNTEYKGGPIWWRQYEKDVSICEGSFTPFHPALIYICKNDGKVDIWNMRKEIQRPVKQIVATGFSVSCLSVVTPPCDEYQISIADTDGNFHILSDKYNPSWNEQDLIELGRFFKQAEESSKQLHKWNKTWQQQSTATDMYGYEHKPQSRQRRLLIRRPSSSVKSRQQSIEKIQKPEAELKPEFLERTSIVEKLKRTNEYKKSLSSASEKLNQIKNEIYEKLRVEVLEKPCETFDHTQTADDIIAKYFS